jgi:hypothetical protein
MLTQERKQQMVDKVYKTFVTDEAPPALDPKHGGCAYLGPSGEKCAFAVNLNDEQLKVAHQHEGTSALFFIKEFEIFAEFRGSEEFVYDLQGCHDRPAISSPIVGGFKEGLSYSLVGLCRIYNLTYPGEA